MSSAYFFLSDITGYTAYLTGSELDHAEQILSALFEAELETIQPPLKVAKLEGDAIFAYLPADQIAYGQTLLDTLENMYARFRKVQKAMHLNTTCTCRACKGISSLDLKFFIHYGDYVVQRLMGQEELAGPAVILAHRLMKNTVGEKTGVTAYALFTQTAIEAMQAEQTAASFIGLEESYEHLGVVPVYVYDLHPFWEAIEQKQREFVLPEAADAKAILDIDAPPAVVWDIITNPVTRSLVLAGDVTVSKADGGRIGIGATYHCAHHDGTATDEIILDWQPLEFITTREIAIKPGMNIIFLMTIWLYARPDNTSQVIISMGPPHTEDPDQQPVLEQMWPETKLGFIEHMETHAAQAYKQLLAERGYR